MKLIKIFSIFALSMGFFMASGTASAQTYCSAGDPHADGLDESDVTWTYDGSSQNADDCYGVVVDNDDGTNIGWTADGAWTALAKSDEGGGALPDDTGSYMGVDFTLSADCTSGCADTSGTYSLSWTDPDPVSLPLTFDFVVVLKASDRFASYLFDDITIMSDPDTGEGSWEIAYQKCNPNNPDVCNTPAISHIAIYVRDGTSDMPEPGTLSLLGLGLLGIGLSRRRKARA